jgi:hypothetical protein
MDLIFNYWTCNLLEKRVDWGNLNFVITGNAILLNLMITLEMLFFLECNLTFVLLITGRFNIDYRKIPLSPEHLLFGLIITGRFKSIDGCITYSHRI